MLDVAVPDAAAAADESPLLLDDVPEAGESVVAVDEESEPEEPDEEPDEEPVDPEEPELEVEEVEEEEDEVPSIVGARFCVAFAASPA